MKNISFILLLLITSVSAQQHPRMIVTVGDINVMKSSIGKYPLFDKTFNEATVLVEAALAAPMDVPIPKDAAGYTHERHKQNYTEMQMAGLLFQITGKEKYARFVKQMLLKYAALYPTLGPHPAATSESSGKIFWQSLNESVWLVNTAQAYDCVYDAIPPAERNTIEKDLFRPMVKFFTVDQSSVFNRIHNHGTWMLAAVGMTGFALHDTNLVSMALYGTEKNKRGGFFNQLDLLFSPDGYYSEGAYYMRYALMPFYLFAQAVDNNRPDLSIFEYRNGILKKAVFAMLQLTYTAGQFIPFNDAMKEKTYLSPEVILALNIAYKKFKNDPSLLSIAREQNSVSLTGGGIDVARDVSYKKEITPFDYKSIELRDGANGDEGGVGLLRNGTSDDQMLLVMKYTGHGLSHGHFDKLSLVFYDQNREQLQDYGSARFVNVDPKYGGRYLPENKSFAMQTIAHNTVTVDEQSHYQGRISLSEKYHADRNFFSAGDKHLQVMSAKCSNAYAGVEMQRTVLMIQDSSIQKPLIVDIFKVDGNKEHTFDLPFYYMGQFIQSNIKYTAFSEQQKPLGSANGYQHLWKEAEATANGMVQFSWLSGNRFYSVSSAADSQTNVFLTRIGANDPDFNLRRDAAVILRKKSRSSVFASVIEPHGLWDGTIEISRNSSSSIANVTVAASDEQGTIVRIDWKPDHHWFVMVSNGSPSETAQHTMNVNGTVYSWIGNTAVQKH